MQISNSSNTAMVQSTSALARSRVATANNTTGGDVTSGVAGTRSAKDEFLDFAKLTPAEKMRVIALNKLKITEEELAAMSPKERQKIEDQVKDLIKQQVMGSDQEKIQRGALLDLKV